MKYIGNGFYVVLAIIVIVVAGGTYYLDNVAEPTVVAPPAVTVQPETAPANTGPKHPLPPVPEDHALTGKLVELPSLDDSDAFFLLEVASTFGPAIESLLVRDAVIDRLVTTVDNLPRGKIAENIRPIGRLQEPFATDSDGETIVLGINSYARYDAVVAQLYYANLDAVYDTYRRFYPLFQKSYERLGYPDGYFNDRLVEVIDHLVAAPVPEGPVVLVRPNVLYEFADPDLEALSSGQKLMIRMGPDNSATLKRILSAFKERLN